MNNLSEIQKAFSQQAERFNEYQNQTFKNAFSEKAIRNMELQGYERVLEIAAGTCALGRIIAPHVSSVTELDITPAMLEAGRLDGASPLQEFFKIIFPNIIWRYYFFYF